MLKLLLGLAAAGAAHGDDGQAAAARSLIVGGTTTPGGVNNRLQALASFRFINNGVESVGCAGVLVSPNLVATSATCIFESTTQTRLPDRIVFNDLLVSTRQGTEVERAAVEGIVHPAYDVITFQNNIALVRLNRAVTTIAPVQLSPTNPPPGTTLTTAGFGRTTSGFFPLGVARPTERSNQLLQIDVQVGESDLQCQKDAAQGMVFDSRSMFCAKAALDQGVCAGDDGGPLIAQDGSLVGVLSRNLNCAVPDESIIFARLGGQSGLKAFVLEQITANAGVVPTALPTRAPVRPPTVPPTRPPQAVVPVAGNGNGAIATTGAAGCGGAAPYLDVLVINNDILTDADATELMGNDLDKDIAFAISKWNSIITSSLPPFTAAQAVDLTAVSACGVAKAVIPAGMTVANMLLMINVADIDNFGKREATAKQCAFSNDATGRHMPRVGIITLDVTDVIANRFSGNTASIIMHQIGHLLGIGSAEWKTRVAAGGYGGVNGVNGVRGFQAIGGQGLRLPVQPFNAALEPNLIEAGVQDAHWSRDAVGNELMGAKLNQVVGQTISLLTLGSLQDLGYQVDVTKADPFKVPATAFAAAAVTAPPTPRPTTARPTAKPTVGAPLLGRRLAERHDALDDDGHGHGHNHERVLQTGGAGAAVAESEWVSWSESMIWPDVSQKALHVGANGTWWATTPRSSLERQIAEESGASSGGSGVAIAAGLGGAFAMLALVAVVSNMRKKNSDAVASSHAVAVDNSFYRKQHSYV